eukprot:g47692.t1
MSQAPTHDCYSGGEFGSPLPLHPAQIHGSGEGALEPNIRSGGIGSGCIDKVGPKQTLGGGSGVEFGPVWDLAALVVAALARSSKNSWWWQQNGTKE